MTECEQPLFAVLFGQGGRAVREVARVDGDRGVPRHTPGSRAGYAGDGRGGREAGGGRAPAAAAGAERAARGPQLPARRVLRRRGPQRGVRLGHGAARAARPVGTIRTWMRGWRAARAAPRWCAPRRGSVARPRCGCSTRRTPSAARPRTPSTRSLRDAGSRAWPRRRARASPTCCATRTAPGLRIGCVTLTALEERGRVRGARDERCARRAARGRA